MAGSILIVDDDPVQRRLVEAALQRAGHLTRTAENGAAALDLLKGQAGSVALLILDLVMPGGPDGLAVLDAMRRMDLAIPVIVQTAQGGIDTVVQAMRAGAFDFVVKPASPEKLAAAVGKALKVEALKAGASGTGASGAGASGGEGRRSGARAKAPSLKDFAARSPGMARVVQLGQKAAATSIPVLIEGESGSGKEVLARAIQAAGERRGKPFVTVNCGAIPESLVESILFGHEKGAFTGATEKHAGKFAEAHGGTLFLDEIGDLPLDAQVKLLRAVQEGEVDPVGGRTSVKVDIRLISATHRDLAAAVRQGRFREDLFYRLHVFPIRLPPLRERRDEIPDLVRMFIARAGAAQAIGRVSGIGRQALALLQAYDWPGNIRQLENAVFRACVLSEGDTLTEAEFPQIGAQLAPGAHLPPDAQLHADPMPAAAPAAAGQAPEAVQLGRSPAAGFTEQAAPLLFPKLVEGAASAAAGGKPSGLLRALDGRGEVRALAEVEGEMIRLAVDHYGGRMSEVARRLGIGRSTLYRKLREYGIDAGEVRGEGEPQESPDSRRFDSI